MQSTEDCIQMSCDRGMHTHVISMRAGNVPCVWHTQVTFLVLPPVHQSAPTCVRGVLQTAPHRVLHHSYTSVGAAM